MPDQATFQIWRGDSTGGNLQDYSLKIDLSTARQGSDGQPVVEEGPVIIEEMK